MPENLRDLQRKFDDSYVLYKSAKYPDGRPLLVEAVVEKEDGFHFKGTPPGAARSVTIDFKNIYAAPPNLGVVNVGEMAIHFARGPQRQWKEGFIWDTIEHTHLSQAAVSLCKIKDPMLKKEEVILSIFNPRYPSFRIALREVLEGKAIVRAFNNKFWVGVSPFTKTPVLGYKKWIVGTINNDKQAVLGTKAQHLKEEVAMYMEVA